MSNICPYPGLRPFTEEESIYFKGRDTHILQIIAQLEQKKFLMLTGASGDGKSSLVYAGVIPNARAGFFKAKFNNWVVADFRPERNPLEQLSKTLSKHLNLTPALSEGEGDASTLALEKTQKELSYGFSSLINLYKSSKFYPNLESEEYKNADEKGKKAITRKGANLLILTDQFEELFTNPENYSKGVSSKESQIVVNLLIETAKMALEQNLPIYIVCTMRSDYIGQCAAFRGLPEMIGFSQFFVPRLKRKEIHQVIEDPALLSGNRISNRLIETLINEMSEGFDQLPILQHTLNALWESADKGNEEMDLYHLASIAGLNASALPKEDKIRLEKWLSTRPEFYKELYVNCSLEQSLSANADILYEIAHEYYNKTGIWKVDNVEPTDFPKEDAQLIIRTAFKCLTKIDEGRAVRNRMTLQEITDILNREDLTIEIVGGILNIFRAQGATFISPFITDNPDSKNLKPEIVLDITHESFIRNWGRLKEWANEEYEHLNTFLDFNKQLQRWITNNKSQGYLLPIGPLTYFENWMNTAKPNKHWFARYDETELSKEEKLIKAEQLLKDAEQFIRRSARKLFYTRTVMKYGAGKITAVFGIIALIVLCSFYTYDYHQKQNPQVIERLEDRGIDLLKSKKVDVGNKADFIINYERLHPNSFEKLLNNINNDGNAFDIAMNAFMKVDNLSAGADDTDRTNPLAFPLFDYMSGRLDNLINQQLIKKKGVDDTNLERLNKFVRTCVKINSVTPKEEGEWGLWIVLFQGKPVFIHDYTKKYIDKYVWILNNAINSRIDLPIDSIALSSVHLNQSIQLVTLLGKDNKLISVDSIINKISPFENDEAGKRFKKLFPKEIISKNDMENSSLNYNGGYYVLSFLYAAKGNYNQFSKSFDSIGTVWVRYSSLNLLSVLKICNEDSFNLENRILKKLGRKDLKYLLNLFQTYTYLEKINTNELKIQDYNVEGDYTNRIMSLAPYLLNNKDVDDIIDLNWLAEKKEIKRNEEVLLKEAVYFRTKGMFAGDIKKNNNEATSYYQKAINDYNRIDTAFLHKYQYVHIVFAGSTTNNNDESFYEPEPLYIVFDFNKRKEYPFNFSTTYFDFVNNYKLSDYDKVKMNVEGNLRNIVFHKFKKTKNDYTYFENARIWNKNNSKGEVLVNKDFLDLVFINKAFEDNDTTKAFNIFERLNKNNITLASFTDRGASRVLMQRMLINLAINNKYKESMKIINSMEASLKRNILIDVVEALHEKGPVENVPLYLDEFFKSSNELQTHYGMKIFKDMAMIGTKPMYDLAESALKDVPSLLKSKAHLNYIRGIIYNNNYYMASQNISEMVSSSRELQLYNEIIGHYIHSQIKTGTVNKNGWEEYDNNFQPNKGADYESQPGDDISFDSLE